MRHMHFLTAAAALVLLAPPSAAQDGLAQVEGDVYRFQDKFHYSLVVFTDEGVVVTDPINADAAARLEAEVAGMTDKPVTHLIYSHSHGDHASGGAVLADTATVIAQANAPADIDGVVPDTRFDDTLELEVGGKTIELTYLGPGHGEDMIAVVVRPENVAFITDVASPERLPYQHLPSSDVDAWIDQIRKVETLDFEIFAPAHGKLGTKADATDARVYMEELRAAVLSGLQDGKSVEELEASLMMEAYSGWAQYDDWRALNIRGMARSLKAGGHVD